MKLLKDRLIHDVSEYEILTVAFDPKRKIIAAGSFEQPVAFYRYPYGKMIKKISHRSQEPLDPLTEQKILESDEEIPEKVIEKEGNKYIKGPVVTADIIVFNLTKGHAIIGYRNGDLLIFDYQSWKKVKEFELSGAIKSLQIIPDKNLLFVATSKWNTYIIDLATWKITAEKTLKSPFNGKAVISSDLSRIYIITDKKRLMSVNYDTLEEDIVYKGHKSGINMIQLSPDEKEIASCGNDGKLSIFDIETGELKSYLLGHSDEVHSFVYSPNGEFIVSSSEDESIRLWDSKTYKCVKVMKEVPNAFTMRVYGELMVMGNVDGEIRTYRLF